MCLDNFLLFRAVLIVTVTCMNQLLFNCRNSCLIYSSSSILTIKALFMFMFHLSLCQKSTKNSLETGRTFATLLSDIETRQLLIEVETEEQFKVWSELIVNSQSWLHQWLLCEMSYPMHCMSSLCLILSAESVVWSQRPALLQIIRND